MRRILKYKALPRQAFSFALFLSLAITRARMRAGDRVPCAGKIEASRCMIGCTVKTIIGQQDNKIIQQNNWDFPLSFFQRMFKVYQVVHNKYYLAVLSSVLWCTQYMQLLTI